MQILFCKKFPRRISMTRKEEILFESSVSLMIAVIAIINLLAGTSARAVGILFAMVAVTQVIWMYILYRGFQKLGIFSTVCVVAFFVLLFFTKGNVSSPMYFGIFTIPFLLDIVLRGKRIMKALKRRMK